MVASLGLGFILENIARFAYGNAARSFAIELARPFRVLDIRMNREQMITLAVSFLAMVAHVPAADAHADRTRDARGGRQSAARPGARHREPAHHPLDLVHRRACCSPSAAC